MSRRLEFIIPPTFDGLRADSALREKWGMSGSLIKELKKYPDGMLLNGEHTRTIDAVHCGDRLEVNIHDELSQGIAPEDIPLDIMYEDEDILIINKAPGMPTHPAAGHLSGTVANAVTAHYIKNGEAHMFRAVNRLDKDTSGVMCIAKNSFSHAKLGADMHKNGLQRKYIAIVVGRLEGEGTIDAPIARLDFIKRGVDASGQQAITHYRALDSCGEYSVAELRLETGRTHQIRVHMSYIGHPLLGDWLYGTEDKELFPRQALHSSYISLVHPVTSERITLASPMADDMRKFMEGL